MTELAKLRIKKLLELATTVLKDEPTVNLLKSIEVESAESNWVSFKFGADQITMSIINGWVIIFYNNELEVNQQFDNDDQYEIEDNIEAEYCDLVKIYFIIKGNTGTL